MLAVLLIAAVTTAHANVGDDYSDTFQCTDEQMPVGEDGKYWDNYQQASEKCEQSFDEVDTETYEIVARCGVHEPPTIFNGQVTGSVAFTQASKGCPIEHGCRTGFPFFFICKRLPDEGEDDKDTPVEAEADDDKTAGEPPEGNGKGDPIDSATGNVYRVETDLQVGSELVFARTYNSQTLGATPAALGPHWTHAWARSIQFTPRGRGGIARVRRADGKVLSYVLIDGQWQGERDVHDTLAWISTGDRQPTSWTFTRVAEHRVETYNANGQLTQVKGPEGLSITLNYSGAQLTRLTDAHGRSLTLAYDPQGRLQGVSAPDGTHVSYIYDEAGRLASATRAGNDRREYRYDEAAHSQADARGYLTGILDAAGERLATYDYQADGRAIGTQLAHGFFATALRYDSDGSTVVTDARGVAVTLRFNEQAGVSRLSEQSGPCETCGTTRQSTYNDQGLPTRRIDFNGVTTRIEYNDKGQETQRIQAAGTDAERQLLTTWTGVDPTRRDLTDAQGHLIRRTTLSYDGTGNLTASCQIDPRQNPDANCLGLPSVGLQRWFYSYCPSAMAVLGCPYAGVRMLAVAPDNTTTQYSYYMDTDESGCGRPDGACHRLGDLYQINRRSADNQSLSFVTTYLAYDPNGRVTRQRDPNGVITAYTYNALGAVTRRTVQSADGNALASAQFAYNDSGDLVQTTDADGVVLHYDYDANHHLTRLTDAQGHHLDRTLDTSGRLTRVQVIDAQGSVIRTTEQRYNALGQLARIVDGLNRTLFDASDAGSYDANGNRLHSTDGLGMQREQRFDALNRLVNQLDDAHGTDRATADTASAFAYDAADQLEGVSDPDGLDTTYEHNGLGQLTALHSPDTGTATTTYDDADRVQTRTDARGITATYSYDTVGRLIGIGYPEASQTIAYRYDQADGATGCTRSYPAGRLTILTQGDVSTRYCYNALGHLTRKQQITPAGTDTTAYSYTPAGRLSGIVYPDGSQVNYSRDSNGRIRGISVTPPGGSVREIVRNVSYVPFGPIAGYTLGNGQTITRRYDASGQLTDIASPALDLHYTRDAMGTVIGMVEGSTATTYTYDALGRLTSARDANGTTLESYTYNRTGDRLSKTGSGLATGDYTYQPNTHWLTRAGSTPRSYDLIGNTMEWNQSGSTLSFGYDDRGRMRIVQRDGSTVATYAYDGFGQRIAKDIEGHHLRYGYDENSQLLSEQTGDTGRDYLWLEDLPVAVMDISPGALTVSYVHADALNTPRAISNESGQAIWTWTISGNPFGEKPPTSSQSYTYNLRFPGQYYDAETGLHYNMHRYYDFATSRYIQADPIGFNGGQASLYVYVAGNPLSWTDFFGLDIQFGLNASGTLFGLVGGANGSLTFGVTSDGTLAGTSLFLTEQISPMAGLGLYAGVGLSPMVGHTDRALQPGASNWIPYFEADMGYGPSASISGNFDFGRNATLSGASAFINGFKGFPGVGGGIMVGVGASKSWTQTFLNFGHTWHAIECIFSSP